ncbi:transient receptor potential cation channel subfamily A member 1-like [Montipora capricornis]|uniref:transient receptor potential cation channel subfamily A member 1-like n=1 Tax=Montipora capricornis TaxID=246305 RepID=UPI0035F13095
MKKVFLPLWSTGNKDSTDNESSEVAASPGNICQEETALNEKHTASPLESSSSQISLSETDEYLKAERDNSCSSLPPPTIDQSANIRKLSLIPQGSDTSDDFYPEENSNTFTTAFATLKGNLQAKIHQKVGKGNKLLHLAALSGSEADVQKLLKKGVDVNTPDSLGKTPLHNAILGKHIETVKLLLKSGADVKSVDERGDTPLHVAVKVNSEAIVTLLLSDSKSDANIKGFGSYTPLHIAAEIDNVDISKRLVENGGDITLTAEDKMTPFGVAVSKGAQSVAEYFCSIAQERQMNVENLICNADNEGSTLLHLAVDSGIVPIVRLCLKLGSNVRQPKESDKTTPLHLACGQGSLEIVQLMVAEDRDVCKSQLLDDQGMVPLHRAALKNHVTVVNYLLDQGSKVDPRDTQGRTPLFLAASVGGTATVQLLMNRGADITLKDIEQRSPLHVAIGNSSTMEALMKSTASKALVIEKDMTGYTAVHYAARAGYLQHIALFINKNKAAVQVTSDSLDTPLHMAARYGWREIAETLLSRNVRIVNLQNNQGRTPLHYACHEGHEQIVQLLLMEGATMERDHHDSTPLHMAAVNGSERCVDCILDAHPESLNAVEKHQNTALNMAAITGHASLVSHLLSIEEQEILLNKYNQNVLDLAIAKDKEEVAMTIIEHSRWKEVLDSAAGGGFSLIQTLVEKMPDVAERILDRCIERDGEPGSEDFKITYDLTLIQGKQDSTSTWEHNSLDALKTMAERRRENCLTHPVCFFLMATKWKKFGWITFMANLLLYLAFLLPFTALAVYLKTNVCDLCSYQFCNTTMQIPGDDSEWHDGDNECNNNDQNVTSLHHMMIIFAFLHIIKEMMQLIKQRLKYVISITNLFELPIYVVALVFAYPICACKPHYKAEAAAISLFFAWLNLLLFFRRFSYNGKYVIMLLTMFQTLLQVLFVLFLFVVAFGTTFFLLMYNEEFLYFQFALMKTFAMTLGELEYEEDFIRASPKPQYPLTANIFFVLFVLAMPIILMNMLIGLAVGDIDKIQQRSVMQRYVMQVELLLEIEGTLPQWILRRVQVDKHEEFPNRSSKLRTKIYEMIVGFGKAESMGGDDELPSAMTQIIEKVAKQESKIHDMHEMLKEQSKLLKAIGQREGLDDAGNRKSIFSGWFK